SGFVAIFGVPQTVARRGQSGHQTEVRTAATRNGSLLIGPPPVWGTAFNTSFGLSSLLATSADLAGPPTAERRGSLPSVFRILLNGEHSMSPPTVTCLSAAALAHSAASFGAFARLTRRTQMSRPHLTRSLQSTWAAAPFMAALSIRTDWPVKCSWRLTVPVAL